MVNTADIGSRISALKGHQGFQERDAYLEVSIEKPGKWLMFVEMEQESPTKIALTCYGKIGGVMFGQDRAGDHPMTEVLESIFIHKAQNEDHKKVTYEGEPEITKYSELKP